MRVPLSWLRDFAPFDGDAAAIAATLDDLGLVVEGIELVGEGLGDVVVARIEEIAAIDGADRIRRVVVTDGTGLGGSGLRGDGTSPSATWCRWPRSGAVLPGGFAIGRTEDEGDGVQRDAVLGPGAPAVARTTPGS